MTTKLSYYRGWARRSTLADAHVQPWQNPNSYPVL